MTESRYMPPWPPEGSGQFLGERRLAPGELALLKEWLAGGAPEGDPADLPPPPRWVDGWQLGPPDLVARMPREYMLPAEGRDIYRNFVVPLELAGTNYVRAFEFRPRSARVHHAFIRVDRLGGARRLEAGETEPGFPGITLSAEAPGGNFLSWQPGRTVVPLPNDLSWELRPGEDLLFQLHMNPSGRREAVQAEIGLYFTNRPPTRRSLRVLLSSTTLDISAGETNYVARDEYRLPIDAELIAILPHAHYLARRIEGRANLPDGTTKDLLTINDWNFNWQSDYRYLNPPRLPKGTLLSMRFSFDNSTNNVANPSNPPKRVTTGPESTDEMAELWFQLVPVRESDIPPFQRDYGVKVKERMLEGALFALSKNPNDPRALTSLGMIRYSERKYSEAEDQFCGALRSSPAEAQAFFGLGLVMRKTNRLREARAAFESSVKSDPWNAQAHGNLGFICLDLGDFDAAEKHFREALRLNPRDALAKDGLAELSRTRRN